MPVTMEDIKWWHYLLGLGLMIVSAIFGAGMASQRFIGGFQNRMMNLEKENLSMKEKLSTLSDDVMTTQDFRREQGICQAHLAESIDRMQKTLDELVKLHLKS